MKTHAQQMFHWQGNGDGVVDMTQEKDCKNEKEHEWRTQAGKEYAILQCLRCPSEYWGDRIITVLREEGRQEALEIVMKEIDRIREKHRFTEHGLALTLLKEVKEEIHAKLGEKK